MIILSYICMYCLNVQTHIMPYVPMYLLDLSVRSPVGLGDMVALVSLASIIGLLLVVASGVVELLVLVAAVVVVVEIL